MSWWNSLEIVARLGSVFTVLGILAASVTVLCSIAVWRLGNRETELREAHSKRTIDALNQRAEELETQLEPRSITQEGREKFLSILSQIPPKKVSVQAVMGDPEAYALAVQIDSLFRVSGWTVDTISRTIVQPEIPGVFVLIEANAPPNEHLVIVGALLSTGLKADMVVHKELRSESGAFVVYVGHKPEP